MKIDTKHLVDYSYFLPNVKKKGGIRWLSWLIIILLLTGVSYIIYRQLVVIRTQEARRAIITHPVERQSLPIKVSANGTVKPERSINISPKNTGILKSLLVKEGDQVKKGQVIAHMDKSNFQGQLTQARGQLAEAQANLQKAIAGNRPQDIAQAEARLTKTQSNLAQKEDDLRRYQELYKAGAISLQNFNQKRSDRDTAQAEVVEAQQALALQKAGSRPEEIQQARAQVTSARGSLQNIQVQINDTIIMAPFDGVVTKNYAAPGAFVTPTTPGSSVSSALSSSILSLSSKNQVVANIAETNIAQIHLGQKVIITADAYPGKTFEGRISQIAAQATVEQNVTSFEVKIAIISDAQKLLRSGMNVETEFQVGQLNNAVLVPTVAVVRQQHATGVFVKGANNTPVFTPIKTGITVNNKTEVRSGLNGNERVLLSLPPESRSPSKSHRSILQEPVDSSPKS